MGAQSSSHFHSLKKKWTKRHEDLKKHIWDKHRDSLTWAQQSSKQLMAGSLAGLVMLTQASTAHAAPQNLLPSPVPAPNERHHRTPDQLVSELASILPQTVRSLSQEQKEEVARTLSTSFNLSVASNLQGKELNRTYGVIGAEQHLTRYPGDNIITHFQTLEEQSRFARSGMAPGRSAWGYFTDSRSTLTQKDIDREKYYIAVQTFLSPGWNESTREYYNFFKYRKMLVVNPENGKAVVVVIGDAGPAPWTGKQLGGSPEVMQYLERQDGGARGSVLYFFIDDPADTVPLGPIQIQ
ncbi:hypothetical protein KC726_01650 [Candidatus Woesebacteria bacterium]|nr:hypothetical protein [Candidatus Woesebacteria bacterium]